MRVEFKTAYKERPIPFSTESVIAIIRQRKFQTRRVINPEPPNWKWNRYKWDDRCINVALGDNPGDYYVICPHGKPGDQLWVKETYSWVTLAMNEYKGYATQRMKPDGVPVEMFYKADAELDGWELPAAWSSPRFMPRWASRINLEITGIRVERLQEISEDDAYKEGYPIPYLGQRLFQWPSAWFRKNWDALNANRGYPWETNPWVWVIEFKKV